MSFTRVPRLFCDTRGISHIGHIDVPLKAGGNASGGLSSLFKSEGLVFRRTSAAYQLSWHPAPRQQFVVNLTGRVTLTSSSGSHIQLGAGQMIYVEDTADVAKEIDGAGPGHLSDGMGTDRDMLFIPCPREVLQNKGVVFSSALKTVHFIRHGTAATNENIARVAAAHGYKSEHELRENDFDAFIESMADPAFFDSRLSAKGRQQVAELGSKIQAACEQQGLPPPTTVLCSALSRALETATEGLAAKRPDMQIVATDLLREFAGPLVADKRRTVTELKRDFPETDFSLCSENDELWVENMDEAFRSGPARAVEALTLVMGRPEQTLAVVSHNGFMSTCFFNRGAASSSDTSSSRIMDGKAGKPADIVCSEEVSGDLDNAGLKTVLVWQDLDSGTFHVDAPASDVRSGAPAAAARSSGL